MNGVAERAGRRLMLGAVGALVAVSGAVARLDAQSTSGRLEGVITDSAHAKPLAGTTVIAVRVDTTPGTSTGAKTDDRGRYRVESLPPGRYMVEFESPFLDSLELTLPAREVVIESGRVSRADFAIPSGATLRAAACPGVPLAKGRGVLFGRALDADTDLPLAGATVVASWTELTVERATLRPEYSERAASVKSDSDGRYLFCGLPTATWLEVQLRHGGRSSAIAELSISDSAGVAVRQLSMSPSSAPMDTVAERMAADTVDSDRLTGTAALSGVVRGIGGLPIAEAQLRIVGAASRVRSDSLGRFALADLPAGTQVLEVRHIGYLPAKLPVELRGRRTISQEVRLQRIVSLDSIRVVAQRSRYKDFEQHKQFNSFGRFLAVDDIERRAPFETSDLVQSTPGFSVVGQGPFARVFSSRSMGSRPCPVNVVIDRMQHLEINLVKASDVGAIELYSAGWPAPAEYDARCGVIVIWTKR